MAAPPNLVRAAGFLIFRRIHGNIEYLLLQTSYGQNHWTPPKGHVDPGEDLFTTALRETKEEAGLNQDQLEVANYKIVLKYDVKGKPKEVCYWLAKLINPEDKISLSKEHQAFKWLSLEEACSLANFSNMQHTLRDVEAYLTKAE